MTRECIVRREGLRRVLGGRGEEDLWVKETEEAARGSVTAERREEAEIRRKVPENSLNTGGEMSSNAWRCSLE